MLAPFFAVGMTAPARQLGFRKAVVGHIVLLSILAILLHRSTDPGFLSVIAQVNLVIGLVEGAALIGWRLTQLPKSLALEFMLVSPVQPRRFFLAEALVGIGRFALISLSGLPIYLMLILCGTIEFDDLWVFLAMPFFWGTLTAIWLTSSVYESRLVRKIAEIVGLVGVSVYLVIGVLAAENLKMWLEALPHALGKFLFDSIIYMYNMNPFGVVRYWCEPDRVDWIANQRLWQLHLASTVFLGFLFLRAAFRLRGHFQDRHYTHGQAKDDPTTKGEFLPFAQPIFPFSFQGRPLSWWAVRRVMEYSGRVNLYLAVGIAILYSFFIVAGDNWPSWMGKLVFQLFESWGGAPMLATALVVLSTVPAAYQFGLWDQTAQDRCKRLELLLLTELEGTDYGHAAFSAAWKRGRGYLVGAAFLWAALAISGRIQWYDSLAAAASTGVLWTFAFALGYRGFATGHQTNGIASLITIGLPMLLGFLWKMGLETPASLLPTAIVFVPLKVGVSWAWAGTFLVTLGISVWILRTTLRNCDRSLRNWYDANQGAHVVL